ncbi:MAG TPA: NAD(P)-dependent oxidoreductase [Candidatus Acidoferrum sp.]|nr:NAD(P)-dependent oxidoreductase [Candidatus Acidoferrum sp.]
MAETLGFIGLGNMGEPIALNLLAAGYGLRVYNRTPSKVAPLVARGGLAAKTVAEVASAGGIVLTMVADDRALEDLCLAPGSFVEKLGAGGVHISLSTIAPATARRLSAHHAKHKVDYLASPVFGRPDAAAERKLWVCTSGPGGARRRAEPIFEAIGQGVLHFGDEPGAANVVKLCGNFLIASTIEALAELMVFAEKNGVSKSAVADMIGKFSPLHRGYAKLIAEQKFEPAGFRLALGFKDINLVLQTAAESVTPLPMASLLYDRWLSAVAKGRGDLDWSAVALGAAEDAGLKPSLRSEVVE